MEYSTSFVITSKPSQLQCLHILFSTYILSIIPYKIVADFAFAQSLARHFEKVLCICRKVKLDLFESVAGMLVIFTFCFSLVADESLCVCFELVGWVLVACLVVMAPVLVGVLDLVVFSKHLLVNELA